jgi:hypothetical protein
LRNYFDNDNDNATTEPLLTLKNKYFSAKIKLLDVGDPLEDHNILYKEDGVLLVFDALQCNPDLSNGTSFDELNSVHSDDVGGDLLRLCVGISLGDWSAEELRGKRHEEEYSRRILWCLDRGYEYCEVDLSKEGQERGHEERDKEGFARLIEAIQGTVWSSAIMQPRVKEELKDEYDEQKADLTKEEDICDAAGDSSYKPPNPSMPGGPISVHEPDGYTDEPETEEEKARRLQEQKEEKSFQDLEGLMREAARIRDMSRRGELSDPERRQRAADAATLMLGLMDQMGLDDDGDHEDSDDKEEDANQEAELVVGDCHVEESLED